MKIILTAGCSFTKYKWPTWANFISWFEPEHRIINLGAAGSSNETIQRSLYTGVNKSKSVDKAFVMWSGTNRYEIVHDKIDENLKKDETVTYSRWNPDFEWNIFYGGHYFKDKHEYNIRWFQNERQNDVRMLERILFMQYYFEKNKIEYKMMCYKGHIIMHDKDKMSIGQRALYDKIDWSRFIFYKDFGGLDDYTEEVWPDQYNKPEDLHPLPIAHYHWVRDIMYKIEHKVSENEYEKLKKWKI